MKVYTWTAEHIEVITCQKNKYKSIYVQAYEYIYISENMEGGNWCLKNNIAGARKWILALMMLLNN